MAFKRKRVYAPAPRRYRRKVVRRRRIFKRKRYGGRRERVVATGNSSANKYNAPYKGRKMPIKSYRKMLWRNTMHLNKYRSEANGVGTIATGTNAALGGLSSNPAIHNNFWVTPNLNQTDAGTNPPQFSESGNFIIRGGNIYMQLVNESQEQIFYRIWLFSSDGSYGSSTSTPALTYDPRTQPDSARVFGTCISAREGYLDFNGCVRIDHKLHPRKQDRSDFSQGRHQLYWIVAVYNTYNASSITVNYQQGYSLSFTGDANLAN